MNENLFVFSLFLWLFSYSYCLYMYFIWLLFCLFVCFFSACFSGLIQTALYADFFYYYFIRYSTSIPILSVLSFTLSIIIITQALWGRAFTSLLFAWVAVGQNLQFSRLNKTTTTLHDHDHDHLILAFNKPSFRIFIQML